MRESGELFCAFSFSFEPIEVFRSVLRVRRAGACPSQRAAQSTQRTAALAYRSAKHRSHAHTLGSFADRQIVPHSLTRHVFRAALPATPQRTDFDRVHDDRKRTVRAQNKHWLHDSLPPNSLLLPVIRVYRRPPPGAVQAGGTRQSDFRFGDTARRPGRRWCHDVALIT